jgi:hypothetical protein
MAVRRDQDKEEPSADSFRPPSSGVPDDKGEFTIRGLEAARYRFQARLTDETVYLRSITMPAAANSKRAIDIAATGLALKSAERASGVIVTFAQGAAALSGRVVAEKENFRIASPVRIHLVPAEKESADNLLRHYETMMKGDGSFEIKNIAPGRYLLVARAIADEEASSERPASWSLEERRRLRVEGEATSSVVELKPCQRTADHLVRFAPSLRK